MKIVNFEEFIKMPKGTVFSFYEPRIFRGLMVKDESIKEDDFFYQDLIGNLEASSSWIFDEQCDKAEKGESIEMDFEVIERDGLFDYDRLFAVYEKTDLLKLINRLQLAFIDECKKELQLKLF